MFMDRKAIKSLRYKVRKVRDALCPKNKECHGYISPEIDELTELIKYFDGLLEEIDELTELIKYFDGLLED
jgi:hypothetical protein